MKKIVNKIFIKIPNFPFALVIGIYCWYNIYFRNRQDTFLDSEIEEMISYLYPLAISVIFWTVLAYNIFM